MTAPKTGRSGIPLDVRATITDRPADLPPVVAYAFAKGGALLDVQRLDEKGNATLTVPAAEEAQEVRVVLGPEVEQERLDVGEVLRRGGVDRHVALRPNAGRLPALEFAVRPEVLRCWIGRLCAVRGTLVKRVSSGGVSMRLPVCNASVDVYEVDPWPWIIRDLSDLDLERLREVVVGPWPPVRVPVPPPPPELRVAELRVAELAPDLLGAVALNPQPLPPRAAAAINPQPEPPGLRRSAAMASAGAAPPAAAQLPSALVLAAQAARPAFERAVIANLDLLRPFLCSIYGRRVRKTRIATVTTDECGHFSALVWRSCTGADQPDLYFVARQRIWPGFWVTIYEPSPVACHTYWDYRCGTEVTLVTTHPLAHTCPPCPPVVAPNNWVLFMAVGNTSVWRIHGANTLTRAGAPGHEPAKLGLLDGTAPWGGTLRPRLEFDSSLRALGVRYYRVSYKRLGEAESEWRPSTEAVNRHYTHEVAGDLILEQYPLGPNTVGATAHLYEIPPVLPPVGQWSLPNVVLDTQSAVIPTASVAPGVGYMDDDVPAGADQGGLWQIMVELFDAGGARVDPEALGIKWRVPESDDLTGTIQTADAAALGLVSAGLDRMVVTVRVDNNPCAAAVQAPSLDGSSAADGCGVMRYAGRGATVTMPFRALQMNRFATYSFYVQRGAVSPPEVQTSGTAATQGSTMPAAPTATVGELLDTCLIAGFTEQLYVAHMATDGWGRQSQYDDSAVRAFVLAPLSPVA